MKTSEDFQYLVIHTSEGWRQGRSASIHVDDQGRLALSSTRPVVLSHDVDRPVAIAFDRLGGAYILDAKTGQLYRYCIGENAWQQRLRLGTRGSLPGQFKFSNSDGDVAHGGLALSKSTLYIADSFNRRIQAFHLPTFRLRYILDGETLPYPEAFPTRPVAFVLPTAILTDRQGYLYVLDAEQRQIFKFNPYGVPVRFMAPDGDMPLQEPVDMAIDDQDVLYILDSAQQVILKFDRHGKALGPVGNLRQVRPRIGAPMALTIDAQRVIHVADRGEPDNSRIHRFDASGRYLGYVLSMGACTQLTTAPDGTVYGLCGDQRRVTQFGGTDRFKAEGTYYSRVLDSTELDCQWHRLLIEADIPDKTSVDVYSYASDSPQPAYDRDQWQHVLHSPQGSTATRDALFTDAQGQYLQLKFVLRGDEHQTPSINLAKIYFQRDSYLRYLPAVYGEDAQSRDFLERFLSIFESMSLDVEDKIATIPRYLDAQATEAAFLDWLSGWLDIAKDYRWSETQQRQFLEKAFQLYAQRGTPSGLQQMIEWFLMDTGGQARVVEHFRVRRPMILGMPDAPRIGQSTIVGAQPVRPLILEESSRIGSFALKEPTPLSEVSLEQFEMDAYDFTVLVNTSGWPDNGQEEALHRLIEDHKPAYTRYQLRTSRQAALQLGTQSILEVNTVLTQGFQPMRLGTNAIIGRGTFVGARQELPGALGHRSRLSIDTQLQ